MQGSNATIPSFLCMHIEMDSSVAKELRKERVSILFIYKITTLSMGERMQSLKSSCLLFSFFKWTEKDDGEWLKVYAISISFTCPWNEMENMVSTPVALVLLIFQAEDSPQCSSPRAKMKNVPQKLLFDLKRLSWAWSNLGYACIPCGVIPRSLFCPAAPQGLNMHMCTNTHTHTHTHGAQRMAQFIAGFLKK